MVAIDVERQRSRCRNLQRLIDDAVSEVEEAHGRVGEAFSRIKELEADPRNLDPIDIQSRQAIEQAIAAREGDMAGFESQLRVAQNEFRDLSNEFEIDQCELFL